MAKNTGKNKEITFEHVIQALLDETKIFPPRYLYKLSDINPDDLPALQEAWPKISIDRRRSLMEDLNDFGESDETLEFYDVGLLALQDQDPIVRLSGVRVLDDYQDDDLMPVFMDMLEGDPSVEVRAAVATALGVFIYLGELEEIDPEDYKQVEDSLLAAHRGNDDLIVRRRALEALGFSSRPEVTELIQAAFDTGDPEWLISSLFAMGRSYNEAWAPNVLSMLEDERPEVRAEAAEAAGELELGDATAHLMHMLEDPNDDVRFAAIWSLSQIGGDEVGDRLEQMLDETEDEVELDLIEQALENLEFGEDLNFDFLEFEDSEDQSGIDEDDNPSGMSRNGHNN